MSLSRKYRSVTEAAAILRDIYGPHAAKKIARDFDVAVVTAKLWLAGRFPEGRTLALKVAVDAELSRIESRNTEIRKQLGLEGRRGAQSGEESGGEAVGNDGKGSQTTVRLRRTVRNP